MTPGQVWWRRKQISLIGEAKFLEEYPLTAAEAFRVSNNDSFISSDAVLRARKNDFPVNEKSPLIIGCDIARSGSDSTCFVWRKGRHILKYVKYQGLRSDEIGYKLIEIIKKEHPAKICIDGTGGFGCAVVDFLRDKGYEAEEIHFSAKPYSEEYFNRRAEIYGELRNWLDGEVSIPDDDDIETDLCSFGFTHRGEKILLESKADIKKRIRRSPDIGDALALCFAVPLNNLAYNEGGMRSIWEEIRRQSIDFPDYSW